MRKTSVDISTRTIARNNFDLHYSEDDFVNVESFDASNDRMNRAWIVHTCGHVLAIVFAEYYAYCEQDALDAACDADKLDSLLISESELADYEVGKDSEGYPEYSGIITLGNASEPFDSENLEMFEVAADIFRLDPVVMKVVEANSRNEASEQLQFAASESVKIDALDLADYHMLSHAADYLRANQ